MVNILIADDNLYYAKMLINADSKGNIKVTHISVDGKETLDILENNNIDIVLLDLKMPIYDGRCIINKLREDGKDNYEQSIIAISGERELINEVRLDSYVYYALDKVCDISKIIDKLEELINEKQKIKEEQDTEKVIISQLQYLNYNLGHKGTQYLIEAIMLIYQSGEYDIFNLKEDIYPIIAKKHKKTIHNIKGDINRANDYMYKVCKKAKIKEYFKFFDDTKPTVKNVIYTILNKYLDKDIIENSSNKNTS